MVQRTLACCTMMLALGATGSAHPRGSAEALAELNDYLMAVQWLAPGDAEAGRLSELWQGLREESWAIRRLTDEEDLEISDPRVVRQIETVRGRRRELLDECRRFFSARHDVMPTAIVRVSDPVAVEWADPLVETPVGKRRLVLIELRNDSDQPTHIEVLGDPGRQIFTWRKSVRLDPAAVRHVFAHVAPVQEGPLTGSMRFLRAHEGSASLRIRAVGTGVPESPAEMPDPTIHVKIRDAATGRPLTARIEIRNEGDWGYWGPLAGTTYAVPHAQSDWQTPLWALQTGPHFYADGEAALGVDPEGKMIRAYRGFEYLPEEKPVPADGQVELELRRWIDMPARGWYSGHTHIHTTDVGMPVPFTEAWPIVARGEDIGVTNILTLKGEWTSHAIYADEYPMGVVPWASDEHHVIAYGEEYRNNPYGHLCLLGLDELIQPISSGALGELGGPDYPPNLFALDAALAQGAVTIGAHFGGSILDNEPIATPWPSTGFEMPADVALGRLQVAEVYGNAGQRDVWYRLLNCGFELAATAGPDWVVKDTPRTYVYLGDVPLSFDAWTEGLRLGRSFITQGPMLFFEVEGQRSGARLHYPERSRALHVRALALAPEGTLPVEVVVNGEVVASGTDLSTTIELDGSAWIAARTEHAHSNPVYVTLAGRPRGRAEDARVFVEVLDRLGDWVRRKGLFDTPDQRETVLSVIREGRGVYESIIERNDVESGGVESPE
jgi:hypothetical protein